jgi:hypothetical protein
MYTDEDLLFAAAAVVIVESETEALTGRILRNFDICES